MIDSYDYLIASGVKMLKLQMQLDTEPKRPARVALYARVSNRHLAQSLEFQLQCLRAAAKRLEMEVTLEVAEITSDAADIMPKRDALPELSREIGFDAVMVTRVDRLGSSIGGMFKVWCALESAGVNFISLFEGLDYSRPHGKLAAHNLATAADFERSLIDEWTAAGLKAARGGKHLWPRSPKDDVERDIALALGRDVKQTRLARLYTFSLDAISAIGQAIRHLWQQGAASPLDCPKPRSDKDDCPDRKSLERGAGSGFINAEELPEQTPASEEANAESGAEPSLTRNRRAS